MKTVKITSCEMPLSLPYGAKAELAKRLGVHPNTIYKARTQGESHPLYGKIMKIALEIYGKPVKTETV